MLAVHLNSLAMSATFRTFKAEQNHMPCSSSGCEEMFQMIQQAKLGDSTGMFV